MNRSLFALLIACCLIITMVKMQKAYIKPCVNERSTLRYAHYLRNHYDMDCFDDAYTVALWLQGIDTTHSETTDRYQGIIQGEINANQ